MKKFPINIFLSSVVLTCLVALALPAVYADENAIDNLKQTSKAFASIAKEVSPAVVNITSDVSPGSDEQTDQDQFYMPEDIDPFSMPPFKSQPMVRRGSGFIITKDGYIVTNNHLVQNAGKITVKLLDDTEYTAKIIGTDPQSDIAVIKIDAQNLPVARLGDSDNVQVGEWVVVLGNPFGLSHSLSAGILSAKGRSSVGLAAYENFLQTDAAINPGNSGGPLIDLEGKVIGINTAIFSRSGGYMGIGFAIPINMAKGIIDQLIKSGNVVRGYLGVKIQPLTSDLAASFNLKDSHGILIAQVEPGSPAEKAGLKQGDVIVSLDNKPVTDVGGFRNTIAASQPNTAHQIGVMRNNKLINLTASVGNLDSGTLAKTAVGSESLTIGTIGMSVQNLTDDVASKLGVKPGVGVVVSAVKPGSIADLAGLVRGSIILEVNRVKVTTAKQLKDEMSKNKSNRVLFLVQDQYGSRFIVINIS